jgi:acyl dehydratase
MHLDKVGQMFGPFSHQYSRSDAILYALAVGAYETELSFVYERHGPVVLPSFPIGPAFVAAANTLGELDVGDGLPLHGEQQLRLSGPIPTSGTIDTEVLVRGIYDKGSGALVDLLCRSSVGGRPLCENDASFFIVGAGGFGGDRGPKAERLQMPARVPDFVSEMTTDRRQAALYRLTLMSSPGAMAEPGEERSDSHIDPASVGMERPLLYGICTLGIATTAVTREALDGDPSAIRGVRARFAAPVHPGQTLTTEIWQDDSRLLLQMKNDDGTVVLANAAIDLG